MRRLLPTALCLATLVASGSAVAAETANASAVRDVIHRRGNNPIQCQIDSETEEDVRYSLDGKAATPVRWSAILRIDYAGMLSSGPWAKGVEARQRGEYEVAADLFNQLATTGTREWEKVKGSFAEGECMEAAGRLDQAAQAFDRIVQNYGGNKDVKPPVPRQRMWIDAKYRKGMCLALSGKDAEAEQVASDLFALGKQEAMSIADVRGNGIRTVIAVLSANPMKFKEYYGKSVFNSERETETWFHYKYTVADKLRTVAKKPKEALAIFREIQSVLPSLPVAHDRSVQVALALGLAYAESDQRGQAVTELLRIDAMPYGSAEQRCEAAATAARLMWEESQALSGDAEAMKNQRTADWAKELATSARLVAQGAAEGPANSPSASAAKILLQKMGK